MSVSYGAGARPITRLNGPVLYDEIVRDVTFQFNPNAIDEREQLYGKQFLSFEIRLLNSKGDLIEQRSIDNIVICPGDQSARAAFYQDKQCRTDPLSLNALLGRKTYDLDEWSRIVVTVKHQASQYADPSYTQTVELVLKASLQIRHRRELSGRPAHPQAGRRGFWRPGRYFAGHAGAVQLLQPQ